MVNMKTHTEAPSFEISKFKNLLEKSSKPVEVTRICDQDYHRSFKLGSKLKYLNSDQLFLS